MTATLKDLAPVLDRLYEGGVFDAQVNTRDDPYLRLVLRLRIERGAIQIEAHTQGFWGSLSETVIGEWRWRPAERIRPPRSPRRPAPTVTVTDA